MRLVFMNGISRGQCLVRARYMETRQGPFGPFLYPAERTSLSLITIITRQQKVAFTTLNSVCSVTYWLLGLVSCGSSSLPSRHDCYQSCRITTIKSDTANFFGLSIVRWDEYQGTAITLLGITAFKPCDSVEGRSTALLQCILPYL